MVTAAAPSTIDTWRKSTLLRYIWHAVGLALTLLVSSWIAWDTWRFWDFEQGRAVPLVILAAGVYLGALLVGRRMLGFAGTSIISTVFLSVGIACLFLIAVLALGRLYYARSFLVGFFLLSLAWHLGGYLWLARIKPRLALVPGGMAEELTQLTKAQWLILQSPRWVEGIDGIVADLHATHSPDWVRFMAECSLHGRPMYHAAGVYETLTGQASLRHHSEAWLQGLSLPPFYPVLKRLMDILIVLLTLPVTVPLFIVIALLIKLDSRGPVLFWQDRMGEGGRPFRIVKFRTMRDDDTEEAKYAVDGDDRVTRAGNFLRKSRLNELPQLWNILRGEMSLIGPRPEMLPFAEALAKEISLYPYRHMVKPGLTGWAQVTQGYAADISESRVKLTYDLFYVKNLSLWIDLLIIFKTVRTIVTGFGAR